MKKENLSGLYTEKKRQHAVSSIFVFVLILISLNGSENMKYAIITNNKLVNEYYKNEYTNKNLEKIVFMEDKTFIEVLFLVRDKIHEGYKLLTHPLTGSVKPYETPYKSIVLSSEKSKIDFDSLSIIESSIEVTKKFLESYKPRNLKDKHLKDFRIIDKSLIDSGIESINQVY